MSERFIVENDNNEVSIKDKVKNNYPFALAYEHIDDADNLIQECLSLVVLLNEQQATITNLQGDVERLKYIIEELRKDNYNKFELINKMKKEEKLYAKEILRLNELNKQINNFNRLCGGY